MKVSFQGPNNANAISEIEEITGGKFISDECFKGKNNDHKFAIGQRCRLVGLENYPEFNGEIVEITSFREDGLYGKAYYLKADNHLILEQLNWVYEYRLEKEK